MKQNIFPYQPIDRASRQCQTNNIFFSENAAVFQLWAYLL